MSEGIPPRFDPDADPLIKQIARAANYLGDIAGQLARIADALQGSRAHKGGAQPAEHTSPAGASHEAVWTQIRTELIAMGTGEAWPRSAPIGFDQVAADYDVLDIITRCQKYEELCAKSSDERRWWGRGMFKETRWPVVMDKTKPIPKPRREMPSPMDPGTVALLGAYGVRA